MLLTHEPTGFLPFARKLLVMQLEALLIKPSSDSLCPSLHAPLISSRSTTTDGTSILYREYDKVFREYRRTVGLTLGKMPQEPAPYAWPGCRVCDIDSATPSLEFSAKEVSIER